MALTFLESLERALKNEPEFGEVFDQRASEHMLADLAAIRGRLGAGAPTAGTKRDYLRWLIGRNLYLDPRGTLQTQRQVQLKLDTIYVTLRAQREEAAAAVVISLSSRSCRPSLEVSRRRTVRRGDRGSPRHARRA